MRYLPHTSEDIDLMLRTVGVDHLDDLFSTIPDDCLSKDDLALPEALTEWELDSHMSALSDFMAVSPDYKVFMGAGSYEHYIPASASYLLGRSEFVTSYTPYQPEVSQGTLQAIYEYQTLAARLLMAVRITKKSSVAVSTLIHPLYRKVVRTYFEPTGYEVIELPYLKNGLTDFAELDGVDDLAAVAVQSPNFFGCIENLKEIF